MPTSPFAGGDKDYVAKLNELANASFSVAATQSANFAAAKGYIYPIDTNFLTVTLPASPAVGDRIAFIGINNAVLSIVLDPNGKKIGGSAGSYALSGLSIYLDVDIVYIDATTGWRIGALGLLDSQVGTNTAAIATKADANNVPRRNFTPAGDFGMNPWTRGTTFTGLADNKHSADRFLHRNTSAAVYDVSKYTTGLPALAGSKLMTAMLELSITTADAAVAAADCIRIHHRVVGSEWIYMAQRPTHLRFWHKHTKTGTYCVALRNSGGDRYLVKEYTQSVSDALEEAVIDLPASPSAGTWVYDSSGTGVEVIFTVMNGSTLSGAIADSWQTGSLISTNNQVNAADTVGNKFRIGDIRFGIGESADATFENITEEQVLAHCRWYYRRLSSNAGNHCWIATVAPSSATVANCCLPQFANMRTQPTLGYSAVGDIGLWNGGIIAASSIGAMLPFVEAPIVVVTVAAGLTANQANILIVQAGTGKYLEAIADL